MRVRAIKDLNQLSQNDFLQKVSSGLNLILQNANYLIDDAKLLLERDSNAANNGVWILRGIAEEEAAKFLILIDAVRCPKKHERFEKHLQNFNDHVAKGIYAKYYNMRPATLGEIISRVDSYRAEYYLDGPQGIDWIFRNRISQTREEMMYVDYIEDDEGHRWQKPNPISMIGGKMYNPELKRNVLKVSQALQDVGCTTPESLSLMLEFWKDIEMKESFHWQELRKLNISFFEKMESMGLLLDNPNFLIDCWLFPIYSIDLSLIKVNKQELREIQERWNPDY